MEIFDIENTKTHGGSNRYYIKKINNNFYQISKNVKKNINDEKKFGLHKFSTYMKFANKVKNSKKKLNEIVRKLNKTKVI